MKQAVAPLQANEVNIIRRKLATFDVKQHEFRENFRKTAPFSFDSCDIYIRIDGVFNLLCIQGRYYRLEEHCQFYFAQI